MAVGIVLATIPAWGEIGGPYAVTAVAGNGATTQWSYAFPLFAASDVSVALFDAGGSPVAVTLNGVGTYDYTVSGTQNLEQGEYPNGVTVTFNTALPLGYTGTIGPAVPAIQPGVFGDYAPFSAKAMEGVLDRIVVVLQQTQAALAGLPDQAVSWSLGYDNGTTMPATGSLTVGVGFKATLNANCLGCFAHANIGATTTKAYSLRLNHAGTLSTLGTITFASGHSGAAQNAALSGFAGAPIALVAGDILFIPLTTADASLSGLTFVFAGNKAP